MGNLLGLRDFRKTDNPAVGWKSFGIFSAGHIRPTIEAVPLVIG